MSALLGDLRHGLRLLIKSPTFTVAAVVTLALGIGANTAIFSAVNAVLLRPLPFADGDRLVRIWENNLRKGRERNPVSPPNFIDWREQNGSFKQVVGYSTWSPNLTGSEGAERIQAVQVSLDLFPMLGANPVVGRYFSPEDRAAENNIVVISHSLWQRRFGSDPNVTRFTLTLNGRSYAILGVMPPGFQFPLGGAKKDLWVPLVFDADDLKGRATRYLQVAARLKPGVSLEQARGEMQSIAGRLEQGYPQTNAGWGVTLVPMYEQLVGDTRPTLWIMTGVVFLVLLIACANVANMLLARGAARQREMALRVALGATRQRIIRQLFTEWLVLATIGGALGVFLASSGIRAIIASAPQNIPRLDDVGIDARVLLFSIGISFLTALIFGLFPALQASRPDLNQTLKEGGRSVVGNRGKLRFRSFLLVVQVSLASALLVCAGLLVKSMSRLIAVDSGFNAGDVLTAQITLPSYKYEKPDRQMAFFQFLSEKVRSLPGVHSSGLISFLPLSGSNFEWVFNVEGRPKSDPNERLLAEYRQVSAQYFKAMGIPLLGGREFSDADTAGAPGVIIINERFAEQYFRGEQPLGKRIGFGKNPEWREIVGVVSNVRHFGLELEGRSEAYVPYLQDPWPAMSIVIRSKSNPTLLSGAVRDAVSSIDKGQPVYNIRSMDDLVSESLAPKRFATLLLGIFSGAALIIAATGVFGVMANSVSHRTHEIGVRIALGARPAIVLRMILLQAAGLALIGVAAGLGLSLVFARFISTLLYQVSTNDPIVFGGVAASLILILIVASYIPARRATTVDPMTALRTE